MSIKSTPPKRVMILGSGFGGLYTALHLEKKLARNPDVEITLVNRENFFYSRRCCTKSLRAISISCTS